MSYSRGRRRSGLGVLAGLIAISACSTAATTSPVEPAPPADDVGNTATPSSVRPTTSVTDRPAANPPTIESVEGDAEDAAPTTTPDTTAPDTTPLDTATPETTTTLAPVPDDVHDPTCVVRSATTGSLELLAATQPGIAASPDALLGLWVENGFAARVEDSDLVDVCVGNGVNDVDGSSVPTMDDPSVAQALAANVVRQQEKLNELFAPFAPTEIAVDGISGPRTGQRLCGARLALGIDASIADMTPGSREQELLTEATTLAAPATNATESERWVLIDRACQLMFVGTGPDLTFVFVTSTGTEGFETRLQDRANAFRFNPAVENGGWHDSSEFPVGVDNPLNGNMYKPLYFDLGQAIHGANSVPPVPDSKGCARLRVADQDTLVAWLGLSDAQEETWRRNEMNVTVTVQGEFIDR